jgi:hypothetical protein
VSIQVQKFEVSIQVQTFEVSIQVQTFEVSIQVQKFEVSIQVQTFEVSIQVQTFEVSIQVQTFEVSIQVQTFEVSIQVQTFEVSIQVQTPAAYYRGINHTHKFNRRLVGPGSSAGIGTGYGLDGPWIESRWGPDFPHLNPDRPWGPPYLLYNGYRVFPGGRKRPVRDADPSPSSSAEV